MARPRKKGIDYFPFDVDFFSDKKIRILKSRFGADGITIYLYLLCEVYRNGYYVQIDEDYEYIIADDLGMSNEKVKQVMKFLLERSLLESTLFKSDTIITSHGIQRRFQEAVKTRGQKSEIEVDGKYWLLSEQETQPFIKCTHNQDYSDKNGSYSKKNNDNSEKKDTKESKVKKSNKNHCASETHENEEAKPPTAMNIDQQLRHDFEIIYALYPKKKGKTVAFANYKMWVSKRGKDIGGKRYRLTNKQIYLAVKKYIRQQETAGQDDLQYWKNFDTLMGRQLLDYVEGIDL